MNTVRKNGRDISVIKKLQIMIILKSSERPSDSDRSLLKRREDQKASSAQSPPMNPDMANADRRLPGSVLR
ncbi:MAG: hypothetical protein ACJAY2_001591 [Pseudomonadales bacterium]|jgi:hypothetical protein